MIHKMTRLEKKCHNGNCIVSYVGQALRLLSSKMSWLLKAFATFGQIYSDASVFAVKEKILLENRHN